MQDIKVHYGLITKQAREREIYSQKLINSAHFSTWTKYKLSKNSFFSHVYLFNFLVVIKSREAQLTIHRPQTFVSYNQKHVFWHCQWVKKIDFRYESGQWFSKVLISLQNLSLVLIKRIVVERILYSILQRRALTERSSPSRNGERGGGINFINIKRSSACCVSYEQQLRRLRHPCG